MVDVARCNWMHRPKVNAVRCNWMKHRPTVDVVRYKPKMKDLLRVDIVTRRMYWWTMGVHMDWIQ